MSSTQAELVSQFDATGVCVLPSLLGPGEVAALLAAIDADRTAHPAQWRLAGQQRAVG